MLQGEGKAQGRGGGNLLPLAFLAAILLIGLWQLWGKGRGPIAAGPGGCCGGGAWGAPSTSSGRGALADARRAALAYRGNGKVDEI